MGSETKISIRQKEWEEYTEYVFKCPAGKDEHLFNQEVVNRLRGDRPLLVGIDTLMLNVRYGLNTVGYARQLMEQLRECGFFFRHRSYLVREPRTGFLGRMMDKIAKMQYEHHIIVFSIPPLSELTRNVSLQLPGEGTIYYIAQDQEEISSILEFLVSPETSENDKYDRLHCIITDGREGGELSVSSRVLSVEVLQNMFRN